MPRTRECDFCGTDIEPGTGTMFVSRDGTTTHFCSSKCEKNADLGREARDLEWTEAGRPEEAEETEVDEETISEAEASDEETVETGVPEGETIETETGQKALEDEEAESEDEGGEVDAEAEADAETGDGDEEQEEAEA